MLWAFAHHHFAAALSELWRRIRDWFPQPQTLQFEDGAIPRHCVDCTGLGRGSPAAVVRFREGSVS